MTFMVAARTSANRVFFDIVSIVPSTSRPGVDMGDELVEGALGGAH
jgi:hypothetical protein